jgi:vesicle coat complex subunit
MRWPTILEDARALDALADAIKDDHADVRKQAIWAIGRIH